ncbi:Uncharacterised protein [Bordetella pertussis]|nr:Uncharacterised protein [Bordetella pertussis]
MRWPAAAVTAWSTTVCGAYCGAPGCAAAPGAGRSRLSATRSSASNKGPGERRTSVSATASAQPSCRMAWKLIACTAGRSAGGVSASGGARTEESTEEGI